MRFPAMTSKTPNTTDRINALIQKMRHARLSRQAKTNPKTAKPNINPHSGKSVGGTLNEKHTSQRGSK
jgi:hypothetical protein